MNMRIMPVVLLVAHLWVTDTLTRTRYFKSATIEALSDYEKSGQAVVECYENIRFLKQEIETLSTHIIEVRAGVWEQENPGLTADRDTLKNLLAEEVCQALAQTEGGDEARLTHWQEEDFSPNVGLLGENTMLKFYLLKLSYDLSILHERLFAWEQEFKKATARF